MKRLIDEKKINNRFNNIEAVIDLFTVVSLQEMNISYAPTTTEKFEGSYDIIEASTKPIILTNFSIDNVDMPPMIFDRHYVGTTCILSNSTITIELTDDDYVRGGYNRIVRHLFETEFHTLGDELDFFIDCPEYVGHRMEDIFEYLSANATGNYIYVQCEAGYSLKITDVDNANRIFGEAIDIDGNQTVLDGIQDYLFITSNNHYTLTH